MRFCASLFLYASILACSHITTAHDIPSRCLLEGCDRTTKSWALMQLTKKKSVRPFEDVDANFITDANNPLEQMYAFEDAIEDPVPAKKMNLVQEVQEFDCKEGVSKLKLGWSLKKKEFCCRTAKVGCTEGNKTETNGTKKNDTSTETNSSVNDTGNHTDNSNSSANVTNNTSNVTNVSTCITRADARVYSAFYTTSPAGTPCVFGVDPRDEGSHCIMEGGKYGSFGWCFTSKSKQSWGACSESCPLFGPSKVLGAKINKLDSELGDRVRAEVKKVLADTRQENTTSVPTNDQTTAAPAAGGNRSGGKAAGSGNSTSKTKKHGGKGADGSEHK
mmetsp:Transcript_85865/g.165295  ORF Transcript_85865/g.165295 Transcript_85865/m.165295 type:complete len:333 (-) Transcript_85865:70-1068(-)